eukprot:TRINITY_DN2735_c0_g2_i1.p1 TRINITY_DN2735_c0_g2~~TRINITY_DN2735_c0_g2_i1.p1  ORF type:complete len:513 (-),score=52.32 TRINITY_DN2735_c0_g2_i1:746-2242(-)
MPRFLIIQWLLVFLNFHYYYIHYLVLKNHIRKKKIQFCLIVAGFLATRNSCGTMNEEYDAIVLGTGLKECIISGLLSVSGRKVLHIDRNNYYGGESASLNLTQLWGRFRPQQEVPKNLGADRDYNVDMVPKFIMGNGQLVKVLLYTDVVRYLDFKAVDGSYVFNKNRICRVPVTDMEALRSSLMGILEKRRAAKFFKFCENMDERKPFSPSGLDLTKEPMQNLYKEFGLDTMTIDFIGHAIALHRDEKYFNQPALPTVLKIRLYYDSLMKFEGTKSPYIYPLYGLGELPQAFARLSAVWGGVYMLNKPDVKVTYDDNGVATGVESEGEKASAKMVVGDPSYFPGKSRVIGQVVRAICIMSHPIPNTSDAMSVQIILPQRQIGRSTDMYVFCCSYQHNVCPKGKWIAFVSTIVETQNPQAELAPGFALLGPIDEQFIQVIDIQEPLEDGQKDKCFISKGYDPTTHFETTVEDVLDMYKRITGEDLDLTGKDPNLVKAES